MRISLSAMEDDAGLHFPSAAPGFLLQSELIWHGFVGHSPENKPLSRLSGADANLNA